MKYEIVAIRDQKLDAFAMPWFTPSTAAAIRAFGDETTRQDSPLHQHPEDYALFHLGTFDNELGRFNNADQPKQLALATEFKPKGE